MADPGRTDRRHPDAPRTASQATPGVAYGPPLVEPEVPVQHVPTTFGTGGTGWRQPPGRRSTTPARRSTRPSPVDPPRVDDASPSVTAADEAPARARPVSPASPIAASTDDEFDRGGRGGRRAGRPADHARRGGPGGPTARRVVVVDGRPRYHLAGCPHLVGREPEPLPVAEAVELGFTPCAHCAPATAAASPTPGRSEAVAGARAGHAHRRGTGEARRLPGPGRWPLRRPARAGPRDRGARPGRRRPGHRGGPPGAGRRAGRPPAAVSLRAGAASRDKLFLVDRPGPELPEVLRRLRDGSAE